jgi:DNA-binding NarL/FixJ family response regulator
MARVLALTADLLFGSRLQAEVAAAGHELELVADEARLRGRLAEAAAPAASLLIVDLTDERLDGCAVLESLGSAGLLAGLATLAYYSHVEAAVRERAERAGFDLIVARSRMAREGAALVERLIESAPPR